MKTVIKIALLLLFVVGRTEGSIVLDDNGGYSNILVAISQDIPQPEDGGINLIQNLKELLTETSKLLFQATDSKVYFKSIAIFIPSSWAFEGANPTTLSFEDADIRLTDAVSNPTGSLPFTLHSGKCGVAGNFITLPMDYTEDTGETVVVRAKGIVQQWAQFRYGVFEEHGFPGDDILPYFYRHPDGYDALTSSNNTVIVGDLKSLVGGDCDINENGIISNQDDCRFIPTAKEQTTTTSLMSFHWLESVTFFSNKTNHDRRPPHRQNRLCNSRSSFEVISSTPDFENLMPNPNQDTTPEFQLIQNWFLPVLYLAIDTSKPSSTANAGTQGQNVLKQGLRTLFSYLTSYPYLNVAWSTFENIDSGENVYLNEEVPPSRYEDIEVLLGNKVNDFVYSASVESRDVSAVIRDAELRLRKYKNIGGSILYIITSTGSVTNDTVVETDMAERLLLSNIKLIVAESGPILLENWETTSFFLPIDNEIDTLCRSGLKDERRTITSKKGLISPNNSWEGFFLIDETVGTNTAIVIRSPTVGLFTVVVVNPSGEQVFLESEPEVTNWNYLDSTVGVSWSRLTNPTALGKWSFSVIYDTTSCPLCETETEIQLQIGSSIRNEASAELPSFYPWVSLTPGSDFVDLSKHPAVIQARFESVEGRIGDLIVTAEIVSNVVDTISLTDTGKTGSDISEDGIYSGLFYPEKDGTYTVSFHAVSKSSLDGKNKLMTSDQDTYCCGSKVPTAKLDHFQITASDALVFEVRNAEEGSLPQEYLPVVSDLQADTYGVDEDQLYVALTWTVPSNILRQLVRYSEDYAILLDAFETANEAEVVFGSLEEVKTGTVVFVYVVVPYNRGKNVYFAVETTGKDNIKTRSHLSWTEPNPPEYVFTPPSDLSTTSSYSTSLESTSEISTETSSSSSSGSSPTSPSTSTADSSSTGTESTETATSSIDSSEATTSPLTSIDGSSSTVIESTTELLSTDSSTVTEDTTSSQSTTVFTTDFSTSDFSITSEITTDFSSTMEATDSSTLSTDDVTSVSTEITMTDPTITDSSTSDSTITDSSTSGSTTISFTSTDSTTITSSSTTDSTTSSSTTDSTTPSSTTDSSTSSSTTDSTISTSTTDSTTSSFTTSSSTMNSATSATTGESTVSYSTTQDPGNGDGNDENAAIGYIIGGVVVGVAIIAAGAGGIVYIRKRNSTSFFTSSPDLDGEVNFTSNSPDGTRPSYSTSSAYYDNQLFSKENSSVNDEIGVTLEDGDMSVTVL